MWKIYEHTVIFQVVFPGRNILPEIDAKCRRKVRDRATRAI